MRSLLSVFAVMLGMTTSDVPVVAETIHTGQRTVIYVDPTPAREAQFEAAAGAKPKTKSDGAVSCVVDFINENANDPKTIEFIRWSGIAAIDWEPVSGAGTSKCWAVRLKLRGANKVGGKSVKTEVFLIQDEQVVNVVDMAPSGRDDSMQILAHLDFPPGSFPNEGPLRKSPLVDEREKMTNSVMSGLFGLELDEPNQRNRVEEPRRPRSTTPTHYRLKGDSFTLFSLGQPIMEMTIVDADSEAGGREVTLVLDDENGTPVEHLLAIRHADGKLVSLTFDGEAIPEKGTKKSKPNANSRRVFKDATGKHKIVAKFVKLDGETVVLETQDGGKKKIPLSRLSKADQEWINLLLSNDEPLTQ